ncbi:unnamed protein product [Linum trigynum]|uniref:Uncharacterized protein n=1 Tax=Linum trigynum TaxID=586398 RepID=A0AAV2CG26_9ROSI
MNMKEERDLQTAEAEVVVAEEGQGAEGMDMCPWNTKMVVGTRAAMPGAEVGVEDVADSVAVVEEAIMVLLPKPSSKMVASMMLLLGAVGVVVVEEVIIMVLLPKLSSKMVASMMLLLKAVGVAVVEEGTVEGAVVEVDRTDRQSRLLHDDEMYGFQLGFLSLLNPVFFSWQCFYQLVIICFLFVVSEFLGFYCACCPVWSQVRDFYV